MTLRVLLCVLLILTPIHLMAQAQTCDKAAAINVTVGNNTEIVPAVYGATIVICGFLITGNTAATGAQFKSGMTNLTGVMLMPINGALIYSSPIPAPYGGAVSVSCTTGSCTGVMSYKQ